MKRERERGRERGRERRERKREKEREKERERRDLVEKNGRRYKSRWIGRSETVPLHVR